MSVEVKLCSTEQAGKSMSTAAMLGIETVRSSNFNVVFIFGVFLKFSNQVLFGSP